MSKSVVLGFSGGIDSMTAAQLLKRDGYNVRAVTLDTVGDTTLVETAALRARELGIDFNVVDVRSDFSKYIIDYFTQSYRLGRTPAPCTVCNPLIKWHHLSKCADEIGADYVATGHYFKVVHYNNHYYVARAADSAKDQSYYLWGLGQSLLSRILTPMCDIIKSDVKQNFSDKRESMGLCFLQGRSYRDFLVEKCGDVVRCGDIVDTEGRKVGRHDGVAFYTIGQKRGLDMELSGVAVVGINAERNELIVGPQDVLFHETLEIGGCNIVDEDELLSADDISVVIRGIGRNPGGFAKSIERTKFGYKISLSDPAWAPAVGQPLVFYRQNIVIGGGIVESFG
ncbi:MAG: tRNA-specific 2-thiouridylase [Alistipes sp.]|nr:tRNA-specific 2-thiouridylase [Alistipes sp.]